MTAADAVQPHGRALTGLARTVRVDLQPVVEVATGACFAVESLARFDHAPGVPVDLVLAAAHRGGAGLVLELACLRAGLARRADLPADVRLSLNVSPDVLDHPSVIDLWPTDLDGLVVEVTEHRASRPAALQEQLTRLRRRGALIAVDDVGAGYAGLLRLATIRPDVVKIDRSVVAAARAGADQGAVLEALVVFSHRLGATVIGEGVETVEDLAALVRYGVDYGQGWLVGLPTRGFTPIDRSVVAACAEARDSVLGPALARVDTLAQLHAAVAAAGEQLGVDVVGLSILGQDGVLREVTASGNAIDTEPYPLEQYPVTQRVLRTGRAVQLHLAAGDVEVGERRVLERFGYASVLIVPVPVAGGSADSTTAVLEIAHATHRPWTDDEIVATEQLAATLGDALLRLAS